MKFGKLAPKHNPRTLLFNKYAKTTLLPPPPTKTYWEYLKAIGAWGMMGNDTLGDCTCACIGHMLMSWTAHSFGVPIVPTDQQIIEAYSAVSGYNPATGMNDNGAAITDVLQRFQQVGLAGRKIDGWVQIDHTSRVQVMQAIYLFGALDIGVQCPASMQDQFSNGQAWKPVAGDAIEGGHSIPLFGYGSEGATCVTWGALQQMTWDWFQTYCDEAYALVSLDWLNASGEAPNHLDVAALRADLLALKA